MQEKSVKVFVVAPPPGELDLTGFEVTGTLQNGSLFKGIVAGREMNVIVREAPVIRHFLLAQNFPNPSNPDTWIPYALTETSEVTIGIYDVKGRLVRRLDLGMKPAGSYLTKEQAAHWDGQSQNGESVASGVYFYVMRAGEYTATRKMVITR